MKNIVFSLLVVFLVQSCGQFGSTQCCSRSKSKLKQNKEIVAKLLKAFTDININAMEELLADDFVWTIRGKKSDLPTAGNHDKKYLIGFMSGGKQMFPQGGLMEPTHAMIAEGNAVASRARFKAITATGKDYNNTYHFYFEINEEGKVTLMDEYMDTAHAEDTFFSK